MLGTPLPDDIRAEWIWNADALDKIESHVFLRREFVLGETPQLAELWVTANSSYQLYVNGRHFSRGPGPGVNGNNYISYFDIGFCLQVGKNVLAVVVHNTKIARRSHSCSDSGFWCQVNLDGEPKVWTDAEWQMYGENCYATHQPRISSAAGFIETLDVKKFPHGWTELYYEGEGWQNVNHSRPYDNSNPLTYPDFEPMSDTMPFRTIVARGKASPNLATTHVMFSKAVQDANGLYAAEAYVECELEENETCTVYVFCDDPYFFFVNELLVKQQGSRARPDWSDPNLHKPLCYQQDELSDVFGEITLINGWNRFLLVQQVEPQSAGCTIVFADKEEGDFKFLRGTNSFSLPGWKVAGPLRTPFADVVSSLELDDASDSTSYYGIAPCDVAPHLLSYKFEPVADFDDSSSFIEMTNDDYAVLELNRYVRGNLECNITGSPGDIIDFVYGNHLDGAAITPYVQGMRKVCTIVLDDQPFQWQSFGTHGMQYLMIVVRQAQATVEIEDMGLRIFRPSFNEPNSFSCSDELMNQLWECGVNTLGATLDYQFLSSAGYLEGQLLGDAMIQALGSFFILGNFKMSDKALREFAAAQLETGEIPALVPSNIHVSLYDFSLLWPVWLQKHVLYSGDRQILEDLLPHLERLLHFFESVSDPENFLLGNLFAPYTNPCHIDYDITIDKNGISTCLNALYCNCLLKSEWLFSYVGRQEEAQTCHRRAARIAHAVRQLTWDEEAGLFADAWYEDTRTESHSMQANVLALYAGIAEPEKYDDIFGKLFFEYAPFQEVLTDHDNENPYFKFFLLETAIALDKRDWAVEYMRYYWGKMVQEGALCWWSKFSPDVEFGPEKSESICHGYGITPNYLLVREVLGIRPVTPGALRVYFSPVLTAAEWVRAQLRTPHGNIKVEWSFQDTGALQIIIDADYPLEVVPLLDSNIAENAELHISDDVSILDPNSRE